MSRKLNEFIVGAGYATVGLIAHLVYFGLFILGVFLHIGTVYIAFKFDGVFSALITLIFPFIAEINWDIIIWRWTGQFWNLYAVILGIYITLWIAYYIIFGALALVIGYFNDKVQKQEYDQ